MSGDPRPETQIKSDDQRCARPRLLDGAHAQMLIQKMVIRPLFSEWPRFVDDRNLRWFREHRTRRRFSTPNSLVGAFVQGVRGGTFQKRRTYVKHYIDRPKSDYT